VVLEELFKKQHHNIHLNLDNSIDWEQVDNDIKINLYRIIQEAINNIHKHSKATEVKIKIIKIGNKMKLQIWDNGLGFNTGQAKKGIGLKNMKTRSQNINGSFSLNSSADGTLIQVIVDI